MKFPKFTSIITTFIFLFFIVSGSYSGIFPEADKDENNVSKLLTEAETNYQNGNFKEAIGIYEKIIDHLNKRKEIVKMKQKLFKTMVSLALTYFTIQETAKSKTQLEKLIKINPNEELDEEIYPPGFTKIFKEVQDENLGKLSIISEPSGASVSIDNKSFGITPVSIKKMVKGEYVVTVTKKGYKVSTKKITVKNGEDNNVRIVMEKVGMKKTIEKTGIKKKKKKVSPLLLVGGAVALGAILIFAFKKKDKEPEEVIESREFFNNIPTQIQPFLPVYSLIEVTGIPGPVVRVEFSVVVNHPRIEDLSISLVGTDNRTIFNVWNKGPHEDDGKIFTGSTEIFNSVEPEGNWKITVNNSNERLPGEIVKWGLRIFYLVK